MSSMRFVPMGMGVVSESACAQHPGCTNGHRYADAGGDRAHLQLREDRAHREDCRGEEQPEREAAGRGERHDDEVAPVEPER